VLGFLSVSTRSAMLTCGWPTGFNPVLGFLSVSTRPSSKTPRSKTCFNPVLGFLSVSTRVRYRPLTGVVWFQSRAGFSECLDATDTVLIVKRLRVSIPCWVF